MICLLQNIIIKVHSLAFGWYLPMRKVDITSSTLPLVRCPTSTKNSVASWPTWSIIIWLPPGCLVRKVVRSYTAPKSITIALPDYTNIFICLSLITFSSLLITNYYLSFINQILTTNICYTLSSNNDGICHLQLIFHKTISIKDVRCFAGDFKCLQLYQGIFIPSSSENYLYAIRIHAYSFTLRIIYRSRSRSQICLPRVETMYFDTDVVLAKEEEILGPRKFKALLSRIWTVLLEYVIMKYRQAEVDKAVLCITYFQRNCHKYLTTCINILISLAYSLGHFFKKTYKSMSGYLQ